MYFGRKQNESIQTPHTHTELRQHTIHAARCPKSKISAYSDIAPFYKSVVTTAGGLDLILFFEGEFPGTPIFSHSLNIHS